MKVELTAKGIPEFQQVPAIVGKTLFKPFGWEFVWWGFGQWYKWRWHKGHIDLGALSVYGFRENHWFWRIVAIFIKPLRMWYHIGLAIKQ